MFRFIIRDVLWLMVIVGMGLGWFAEHSRLTSKNNELAARATEWEGRAISMMQITERLGITVEWIPGGISVDMTGLQMPSATSQKSSNVPATDSD
jgi:hypothetical protein